MLVRYLLLIVVIYSYSVIVASMARHIYLRPGVGVGAFKTIHGNSKNRGNRPSHHAESSGSVARKALQALEKLSLLQKDSNGYVFCTVVSALCIYTVFLVAAVASLLLAKETLTALPCSVSTLLPNYLYNSHVNS